MYNLNKYDQLKLLEKHLFFVKQTCQNIFSKLEIENYYMCIYSHLICGTNLAHCAYKQILVKVHL